VQSARSKLPAPVNTPPKFSPRSSVNLPSTVTIRSRKRTAGSTTSSMTGSVVGDDATPTMHRGTDLRSSMSSSTSKHVSRLSTSGVSRLSFGPLPNRNPGNVESEMSRPSSRASVSSYARPASRTDSHTTSTSSIMPPPRPMSRASLSGARTPLGRPRSSLGGSLHGHSQSVSYSTAEADELAAGLDGGDLRTPSRRGTYSRFDLEGVSGIPAPSSIPMPSSARRQSGGGSVSGRRASSGAGLAGIPALPARKLEDVGETY